MHIARADSGSMLGAVGSDKDAAGKELTKAGESGRPADTALLTQGAKEVDDLGARLLEISKGNCTTGDCARLSGSPLPLP